VVVDDNHSSVRKPIDYDVDRFQMGHSPGFEVSTAQISNLGPFLEFSVSFTIMTVLPDQEQSKRGLLKSRLLRLPLSTRTRGRATPATFSYKH
jgi:hypothetical protein